MISFWGRTSLIARLLIVLEFSNLASMPDVAAFGL